MRVILHYAVTMCPCSYAMGVFPCVMVAWTRGLRMTPSQTHLSNWQATFMICQCLAESHTTPPPSSSNTGNGNNHEQPYEPPKKVGVGLFAKSVENTVLREC